MIQKLIISLFSVFALILAGDSAQIGNGSLSNACYSAYQAMDQNRAEEAITLFEKELAQEETYIAMIGLARAQLAAEKPEEAKETLLKIVDVYPEETAGMYYLAAAYTQLEEYPEAVETYQQLLESNEDSDTVMEKMIACLWKTGDYTQIYQASREMYLKYPEKESSVRNLVKACAAVMTDDCEQDLLSTIAGSEAEYEIATLINAFHLLKSGDVESAASLLEDSKHAEELTVINNLAYGDIQDGEFGGTTVAVQNVFGVKGIIYGNCYGEKWDGACHACYSGLSTDTFYSDDGSTITIDYCELSTFDGNWTDGKPEGEVKMIYQSYTDDPEEPEPVEWEWEETTFNFQSGKADGRTETVSYWYNGDGEWSEDKTVIHVFSNGRAQAFTAETEDGERLVYELRQYTPGLGSSYTETNCGHSYIWN
ncbi:MAG: hypothetical protein LUD07_10900 [Clostridiales bacterium]|nr:hypothetical protein [Clostridiales bacterium]